ncbi:beta-carotene 15,15'-monooxygenase [Mucilaginibacter terrenus]|uniref:Beta-carotene 15,15'-monooxygenase n=1 Tax=Mucilaginibacter terrenus TaxID=2482727 RepID=A0A3E2NLB9_9SPHI|nr:DUF6427 family protein [Mucilaginibacter terrenus]RFZ81795.1 beta-carotene 15,15'-monooxygenase [Mucilaginibacter terrenus]
MVNFFKLYNPLSILWLAILLYLLRIGFIVSAPDKVEFIFVEPFARLLVPVTYEYAFSPALNVFLAGILVLGQAVLVNYFVNHYNLLGKPTFLPALMYVTIASLFKPFMILSAPLICNFLLIWMLFKLASFYKGDDAKSTAYDLGIIVAIGSLIYLPFIFMFLAVWIGLIIFRPFSWREWVSAVLGYVTVFFFLAVIYYLSGRFGNFFRIWAPLGSKFPNAVRINYLNYLVLVPVLVILALYFIKLQQNFYKSYVQVRKCLQLLFFVLLIAGLSFYIKAEFNLVHFIMCVVPLAVFFSYYFHNATKRWFYEGLYLLLLISIVYFQFNTF